MTQTSPPPAPGQTLAPVAMFVYNREDNTLATLRALLANTLAPQTQLYVFSDGGRDAASWEQVRRVRRVLHEVEAEVTRTGALAAMTIVERPENFYLERNVIEGIGHVLSCHATVVVLEDDIVTSPHFLQFMNEALRLYRDEPRVMHVTGFTRIERDEDFYFTRFMAGWGWGTWADRWHGHFRHYATREEALAGLTAAECSRLEYGGVFPCLGQLERRPIPWDICWGIAICRAGGLCLAPGRTLVRNIGLDAGTHFRSLDVRLPLPGRRVVVPLSRLIQRFEFDREPSATPMALRRVAAEPSAAVEAAMGEALRDWGIRYTWFGAAVRRAYRWLRRPTDCRG